MTLVWTPDFSLSINGWDATKDVVSWQLDDVENGISTLRVVLGNPDGMLSGYFRTETSMTLRYGYWNGSMSQPVTMTIKDKKESFETHSACTISLVGMDCTERLTGVTHAGMSKPGTKLQEAMESLIKGTGSTPDISITEPPKLPNKLPLHNMTAHAAVRWLIERSGCKDNQMGGGTTPLGNQKQSNAGQSFPSANSVTGGRDPFTTQMQKNLEGVGKANLIQKQNQAGNSVITGHLECVGIPGLQAKKCVTVQNVGAEASGKWYVKKSSQRYHVDHGYRTFCELLRPTLGKDGKPIPQPVVMYADIYKKDTIVVKCRPIDAESQYTFNFGQPTEDGAEQLISFHWGIQLQKGRGAGEWAQTIGWAINQAQTDERLDGTKQTPVPPQSAAPPDISSVVV